MKKLILIIVILMMSVATYGEVVRSSNNFTAKSEQSATKSKVTNFTYTDSKGKVYPIYIGTSGGVYILKISKRTGKEYKHYLPKEVAEQIRKELKKK